MRKSATNDDVLSTREAAERLGVALRTVQLWVEGGVLPAWKTAGGHRRISRVAVERLIRERSAALSGEVAVDAPAPAKSSADSRLQLMVVEDEPELLRLFLDANQIGYKSTDLGKPLDGVQLAEQARGYTVQVVCTR